MPNVQVTIRYSLKNDGFLFTSILVIPLPCYSRVLPLIMHTIQRCKHSRKATLTIHSKLSLKITLGGLSQMMSFILLTNSHTKSLQRFHRRCLTSAGILISCIGA
ncbi:hypothetical protein M758_5G195500 [Ceratodon purpureus]|uniref:Uncharacterized protein n=1 Tax=Ceratodon purpureus TaxID=3225 RepID=A0A8T0I5U0_CERPU|nr:hypothetical protein KC19_5G202300 [Ceratodon purpureus]KAG0617517.1 hypothetical protein M758_5G195500 [Ceratodon purpureus]